MGCIHLLEWVRLKTFSSRYIVPIHSLHISQKKKPPKTMGYSNRKIIRVIGFKLLRIGLRRFLKISYEWSGHYVHPKWNESCIYRAQCTGLFACRILKLKNIRNLWASIETTLLNIYVAVLWPLVVRIVQLPLIIAGGLQARKVKHSEIDYMPFVCLSV